MKIIVLVFISMYSYAGFSQSSSDAFDVRTWKPPYNLATPAGWDVERFVVPPDFAPQIACKGVEDIRFTPGWGKVNSGEYWSYAFLWWLDGSPEVNEQIIAENLKSYYSGLVKRNLEPRKIPAEKLVETKATIRKAAPSGGDALSFVGTVEMLDYMEQKPMILNVIIHVKSYAGKGKTVMFYEVSPKAAGNPVWENLHKLWNEFSYP